MSTPPKDQRKRVTLTKLAEMRALGEPIVMITAYDHPSALVVEQAGVDVVLVGDSAANNVLGYSDTVPVTVEELLMLTRAVRRGLKTPLLVGDLPFGSYEASDSQAIETAHRFVKEAGCDAVKLEGGGASADRARAIVRAGVPVMGHVGLTPQTATMLGGYRAQGRTAARAKQVFDDALALQEAGCFCDRLRGDPRRGDRRDHAAPRDPGDRDRRRPEHRRPGARPARPAGDPRRLQAEVRQALRRGQGGDAARRRGLRRRGPHAQVPRRPSTPTGSRPRNSSASATALAASSAFRAGDNNSFTIHWPRDEPAVPDLRAQGTGVLRPLRGGREQRRTRRRTARAHARAVAGSR